MADPAPNFSSSTTWKGGSYDPNASQGMADTQHQSSSNQVPGNRAVNATFDQEMARNVHETEFNRVPGDRAISENYDVGMGGIKAQHQSSLADPSEARLMGATADGTPEGSPSAGPAITIVDQESASKLSPADWRVRIGLSSKSKIFYKDKSNEILAPLRDTDGVIFPYLPEISITHTAAYSSSPLVHTNYSISSYTSSDVSEIQITGEFTVQNSEEGQYLLAAIYFFRAATKMFFGGEKGGLNAGSPPPIVFLDGYGSHYLPHVPCVITSFQHNMPGDVDYLSVPVISSVTTTEELIASAASAPGNFISGPENFGSVNVLDNQGIENIPSLLRSTTGGSVSSTGNSVPGQAAITERSFDSQPRPNFGNQSAAASAAAASAASALPASLADMIGSVTTTAQTVSYTRVPTRSTMTISLKPMYSRLNLFNRFNLDDFAAGRLISGPGVGGYL